MFLTVIQVVAADVDFSSEFEVDDQLFGERSQQPTEKASFIKQEKLDVTTSRVESKPIVNPIAAASLRATTTFRANLELVAILTAESAAVTRI